MFNEKRAGKASAVNGRSQRAGERRIMGIGISLLMIAAGAVLTFAVDATVSGLDIATVGVILMVVGGIGFLASLVFWSSWGGSRTSRTITRTADGAIVTDPAAVAPGTAIVTTFARGELRSTVDDR